MNYYIHTMIELKEELINEMQILTHEIEFIKIELQNYNDKFIKNNSEILKLLNLIEKNKEQIIQNNKKIKELEDKL